MAGNRIKTKSGKIISRNSTQGKAARQSTRLVRRREQRRASYNRERQLAAIRRGGRNATTTRPAIGGG